MEKNYEKELWCKINEVRMAAYSMNIAAMNCQEGPKEMMQFHEEDTWFIEATYELGEWIKEHYIVNEEKFKEEEKQAKEKKENV